ncbi:TIGR02466 family protein [Thiosocius teredinicola]|uniref:TIGR02466 family protein n=1 Tax=Thiosocius teredinicola TaxID=1973002 RepID=UPI000990CCF6
MSRAETAHTAADAAQPLDIAKTIVPLFASPISNYIWPESEAINDQLRHTITEMASNDPGIQRSNVGGWHSRTDFFNTDAECVSLLHDRISQHIKQLMHAVAIDSSASNNIRFAIEGWANVLRYGQYHSVHSHPNAFWSGVYYVSGNPVAEADHPFSGKLELLDPRPGAALSYAEQTRLYGRFLVNPRPGQMVVFPGWMQHQVHPFFGPDERITVAFNVVVE